MNLIQYEKQNDPFYSKRKKELRFSDEEMELYASCNIPSTDAASQAEKILRRLYHSRWLTAGAALESKDIVMLIMLKIPYATIEFLGHLKIFGSNNNAGTFISRNIQSEKNRNGFIRTFSTQLNRCRKIYTLTNAARQEVLSMLPEEIQKQLPLSKSLSAASNVHDAFSCNLYYYFLSDLKFAKFNWYFVPCFNLTNTFAESVKNIDTSFHENTDALRPDAFIMTDSASYYFVEQDMNTERAGRLSEKFKRYEILFSKMEMEHLNSTAILFSVFSDTKTRDPLLKNIEKNANSEKEAAPSKLRRIQKEFAFYLCISDNGAYRTVTDIENDLIKKRETNTVQHHPSAVKSQLNEMIKIISRFHRIHALPEEDTIDNLFSYIDKQIEVQKNLTIEENDMYTNRIISSRKESLKKIIDELPIFQSYLQKGVKFVVTDTFCPDELRNVLLVDHNDDVLSDVLLPSLEVFLNINSDVLYSPVLDMGGDVYLCNHCEYEDYPFLLIAVENISMDLGAWYRLKNFIERAEVFPQKDKKVYVIILASSMDDIRNFNESIYEHSTVAERYCDETDATKPKANIQFLYSCYEKQENIDKFFVLDRKGDVVYV